MRNPNPTWENLYLRAGASGVLLLAFKNPSLRGSIGKTLADVAAARGVSPEDAAIDLVIENRRRSRITRLMKNLTSSQPVFRTCGSTVSAL
jgi:N-acyl-D-amino-acid deacylase